MNHVSSPRRYLDALLAVSAVALISATSSAALALECGDRVTESTTLQKDLTNCPGVGLIISGESKIVLDLNFNSIRGAAGSTAGIVIEHADNVRVHGLGTVAGFDTGIAVRDSDNIDIHRLRLDGNRASNLSLTRVAKSEVVEVESVGSAIGAHLLGAGTVKNTIEHSLFARNQQGVRIEDAASNRVRDSQLQRNLTGLAIVRGSSNSASDNRVEGGLVGIAIENTAAHSGFSWPSLHPAAYADDNEIAGNTILGAKVGVRMVAVAPGYQQRNEIARNRIEQGRIGIELVGSNNFRTRIATNQLVGQSSAGVVNGGTQTELVGNTCTSGTC